MPINPFSDYGLNFESLAKKEGLSSKKFSLDFFITPSAHKGSQPQALE